MFCSRCRLHFSRSSTGGCCPSCGGVADRTTGATPFDVVDPARTRLSRLEEHAPENGSTTGPDAGSAGVRREGTRTDGPGGDWDRGRVVAGKYEIIRKIGSGGFGSVFKVRHVHRKKLYALKVPHLDYLRDETFQKRFEREIEVMERFVHPDMVTVRDSGLTESGVPYFTMDFIDGESLRDVMAREGALDVKRAVNIVRRILEVLDVAHSNKIIHRDIKPDNILLTKHGGREVVKVLDFGVAKILDPIAVTKTITHGLRVGTPKYMSPEQVTGEDVDGRSDLFAVGIVLYEAITGRHPFSIDRDPIRTTASILSKEPFPPCKLREEIPRALSDRVMSLLEKKARRRPQSARAVLDSLPDLDGATSPSALRGDALVLVEGAHRAATPALVFSTETSAGTARYFLFMKDELSFGRANDSKKGVVNDVVLRRLPCRSKSLDRENWDLNLTISGRAGSLRIEKSTLVIEPGHAGIVVGGLRSGAPVRIQSDHFHMTVGNRALEIDGFRSARDRSRPALDLGVIPPREEAGSQQAPAIGYSNPSCLINCVRLTRSDNYPLHSYFLVPRRIAVGSGAGAELRLRGDGVEGHHASLLHERGELFIVAVGGVVRIRGSESGTWGARVTELTPGELYPITPGLVLGLGSVILEVGEVDESLFKRV